MSLEIQRESTYELQVAQELPIWQVAEQKFIEQVLSSPPTETVEDVGAVAHETNRIPDPRILIVKGGEIWRLDGVRVDESIEKESYLGKLEYSAFREIKSWAGSTASGAEAWFSAPFPETLPPEKRFYPVSKIDLGAIRYSVGGEKILLKRAIILDIDSATLLSIANNFLKRIGRDGIKSSEELRSSPIFFDEKSLYLLLSEISNYSEQTAQVENGRDLRAKIVTYSKLTAIHGERNFAGHASSDYEYAFLRQRAEEENMIGEASESCPGQVQTAFRAFSGGSETDGVRILNCTCPNCTQRVDAVIFAGTITCPRCGAVAPYVC